MTFFFKCKVSVYEKKTEFFFQSVLRHTTPTLNLINDMEVPKKYCGLHEGKKNKQRDDIWRITLLAFFKVGS